MACRLPLPLPRGAERPPYGPGAESRLVVLDARTGERVTDRSLGVGFESMDAAGRDVVLLDVLPDGRPVVTREDPVRGTVHWTFHGDVPMPSAGLGTWRPTRPYVAVQGDVVTVIGPISWALSGRLAVGTASTTPEPGRRTDVPVVTPGTDTEMRLAAGLSGRSWTTARRPTCCSRTCRTAGGSRRWTQRPARPAERSTTATAPATSSSSSVG